MNEPAGQSDEIALDLMMEQTNALVRAQDLMWKEIDPRKANKLLLRAMGKIRSQPQSNNVATQSQLELLYALAVVSRRREEPGRSTTLCCDCRALFLLDFRFDLAARAVLSQVL